MHLPSSTGNGDLSTGLFCTLPYFAQRDMIPIRIEPLADVCAKQYPRIGRRLPGVFAVHFAPVLQKGRGRKRNSPRETIETAYKRF